MTPDQLRALADALEPMAKAPRFDGFDVPAFCAWVRACADAKPVGYVTANGLRSLRQDDATVLLYAHDYLIRPDHVALYTHPAPAVPAIEERGPWSADQRGRHVWVDSDDFTHDVRLVVNGDFESDDQKFAYAQEIARRLNAAPAAPQADAQPAYRLAETDIYDFAGWLTCRNGVMPVGSTSDAAPMAEAVGDYIRTFPERFAAAPAVPQAEPDDDDDALVLGEPDMLTPEDVRRLVPQAEPKRDWSVIDAAICEYLDGYEQIGENDAGADACYTPTERERDLIYDAINGLLADEHFMRLIAPHPAPAVPAGWKLVPVEPTPEMLGAVGMMDGYDCHAPGCSPDADHANWYSAMIAAAPAAPQAEPCIGNDPRCPCQDGDACHYKDSADGTKAWPVPQAEPKREPLSDAIVTVVYELAALIPKPDQPTVDDWPCDNQADRQALQIAYTTARDARDGIGGSDD